MIRGDAQAAIIFTEQGIMTGSSRCAATVGASSDKSRKSAQNDPPGRYKHEFSAISLGQCDVGD
jgi:hypothetical protein